MKWKIVKLNELEIRLKKRICFAYANLLHSDPPSPMWDDWKVQVKDSFFKKMGQYRPLFCFYFRSFLVTISIPIEKSIDSVLGIRTRGRRMVGADKTMELWRPPKTTFADAVWERRDQWPIFYKLFDRKLWLLELYLTWKYPMLRL